MSQLSIWRSSSEIALEHVYSLRAYLFRSTPYDWLVGHQVNQAIIWQVLFLTWNAIKTWWCEPSSFLKKIVLIVWRHMLCLFHFVFTFIILLLAILLFHLYCMSSFCQVEKKTWIRIIKSQKLLVLWKKSAVKNERR